MCKIRRASRIYSLYGISIVTTCDRLCGFIKAHLGDDLRDIFDVGYYHNNSVVSILEC